MPQFVVIVPTVKVWWYRNISAGNKYLVLLVEQIVTGCLTSVGTGYRRLAVLSSLPQLLSSLPQTQLPQKLLPSGQIVDWSRIGMSEYSRSPIVSSHTFRQEYEACEVLSSKTTPCSFSLEAIVSRLLIITLILPVSCRPHLFDDPSIVSAEESTN